MQSVAIRRSISAVAAASSAAPSSAARRRARMEPGRCESRATLSGCSRCPVTTALSRPSSLRAHSRVSVQVVRSIGEGGEHDGLRLPALTGSWPSRDQLLEARQLLVALRVYLSRLRSSFASSFILLEVLSPANAIYVLNKHLHLAADCKDSKSGSSMSTSSIVISSTASSWASIFERKSLGHRQLALDGQRERGD